MGFSASNQSRSGRGAGYAAKISNQAGALVGIYGRARLRLLDPVTEWGATRRNDCPIPLRKNWSPSYYGKARRLSSIRAPAKTSASAPCALLNQPRVGVLRRR